MNDPNQPKEKPTDNDHPVVTELESQLGWVGKQTGKFALGVGKWVASMRKPKQTEKSDKSYRRFNPDEQLSPLTPEQQQKVEEGMRALAYPDLKLNPNRPRNVDIPPAQEAPITPEVTQPRRSLQSNEQEAIPVFHQHNHQQKMVYHKNACMGPIDCQLIATQHNK